MRIDADGQKVHLRDGYDVEVLFGPHIFEEGEMLEEVRVEAAVLEREVRLDKVGEFFDFDLVALLFEDLRRDRGDLLRGEGRHAEDNLLGGLCRRSEKEQSAENRNKFFSFVIPPSKFCQWPEGRPFAADAARSAEFPSFPSLLRKRVKIKKDRTRTSGSGPLIDDAKSKRRSIQERSRRSRASSCTLSS